MSSNSQKSCNFVVEPLIGRDVTALPGIGRVYGGRLKGKGYDKAVHVLGQFLIMKKNKKEFKAWLKRTVNANSLWSNHCFDALVEWCENSNNL